MGEVVGAIIAHNNAPGRPHVEPPPDPADAERQAARAKEEERKRQNRKKGRASTIIGSPLGRPSKASARVLGGSS